MILRVVVFYVLTFVLTIALGGIQEASGLSSQAIILPQWGPGLAALLTLLLFRKDEQRFSIFARRIPAQRYLLAALIPLGGGFLIFLINVLLLGALPFTDPTPTPWILLLWMPIGAFGEELGWRGYLHKRLNISLPPLASSFIVGLLWALWHVGMYQNGAVYMAFFVLLMVSYTIVIQALVVDTGFNVLVAAIFHLMINIGGLLSFSIINTLQFMVVSSLVWAGIAAIVAVVRRSVFKTAVTV